MCMHEHWQHWMTNHRKRITLYFWQQQKIVIKKQLITQPVDERERARTETNKKRSTIKTVFILCLGWVYKNGCEWMQTEKSSSTVQVLQFQWALILRYLHAQYHSWIWSSIWKRKNEFCEESRLFFIACKIFGIYYLHSNSAYCIRSSVVFKPPPHPMNGTIVQSIARKWERKRKSYGIRIVRNWPAAHNFFLSCHFKCR